MAAKVVSMTKKTFCCAGARWLGRHTADCEQSDGPLSRTNVALTSGWCAPAGSYPTSAVVSVLDLPSVSVSRGGIDINKVTPREPEPAPELPAEYLNLATIAAVFEPVLYVVTELHGPQWSDGWVCRGCSQGGFSYEADPDWPCATTRLIADELGAPLGEFA